MLSAHHYPTWLGWNHRAYTFCDMFDACARESIRVASVPLPFPATYLRERQRPLILLAASLDPRARTEALAHELGHHFQIARHGREQIASEFSACLLIPRWQLLTLSRAELLAENRFTAPLLARRWDLYHRKAI